MLNFFQFSGLVGAYLVLVLIVSAETIKINPKDLMNDELMKFRVGFTKYHFKIIEIKK